MLKPQPASDWAAKRGEKWRAYLDGMEAMLEPIDEPLIRALKLDAPYRIAEIGCGGGGTTFEVLRCAPVGSVVHGFDISPALIEIARERTTSPRRVAFDLADMETAAVTDPYDRLFSRFGIMFFSDPLAAFVNLFGWLVPGGRFAFAVWGSADVNPWEGSVRQIVSKIVDLPRPAPDSPGPFRYGEVDALVGLLRQAGYGELDVSTWRGALSIGGGLPAEDAANFALASFSSFSEMLDQAGAEARDRAHRSLSVEFSQHEDNGEVRMDACAHIVTGTRPV